MRGYNRVIGISSVSFYRHFIFPLFPGNGSRGGNRFDARAFFKFIPKLIDFCLKGLGVFKITRSITRADPIPEPD